MKFNKLYVVAMALVVGSNFVNGEESLKQPGALGKSTERNEDKLLEHIRSALRTPGVSGVSSIFGKSKKVMVTRGRSGQIRIFVGDVSDELLETKINVAT